MAEVETSVEQPMEAETKPEKTEPEEAENLRKIFTGGLNRETTDEQMKEYFEKFGEILDCIILRDSKNENKSKGFGFVTYRTIAETDACIKQKKTEEGHVLSEKTIEVKRAIPKEFEPSQHEKSQRMYINLGKVKEGITEDQVKEYFESKYECKCESVELIKDKKEDTPEGQEPQLRGFGFVTVDDMDAVDKIVIERNHTINGIAVFAKKAEPKGSGGGRGRGGRGGRGWF